MYECGKEAGKKEYALQASLENQKSVNVDDIDIRDLFIKFDKDAVGKSC